MYVWYAKFSNMALRKNKQNKDRTEQNDENLSKYTRLRQVDRWYYDTKIRRECHYVISLSFTVVTSVEAKFIASCINQLWTGLKKVLLATYPKFMHHLWNRCAFCLNQPAVSIASLLACRTLSPLLPDSSFKSSCMPWSCKFNYHGKLFYDQTAGSPLPFDCNQVCILLGISCKQTLLLNITHTR